MAINIRTENYEIACDTLDEAAGILNRISSTKTDEKKEIKPSTKISDKIINVLGSQSLNIEQLVEGVIKTYPDTNMKSLKITVYKMKSQGLLNLENGIFSIAKKSPTSTPKKGTKYTGRKEVMHLIENGANTTALITQRGKIHGYDLKKLRKALYSLSYTGNIEKKGDKWVITDATGIGNGLTDEIRGIIFEHAPITNDEVALLLKETGWSEYATRRTNNIIKNLTKQGEIENVDGKIIISR